MNSRGFTSWALKQEKHALKVLEGRVKDSISGSTMVPSKEQGSALPCLFLFLVFPGDPGLPASLP